MTIKNPLKRVIAGALAVLVMACSIPANADLGGIFGGTDIVASAEKNQNNPKPLLQIRVNPPTTVQMLLSKPKMQAM